MNTPNLDYIRCMATTTILYLSSGEYENAWKAVRHIAQLPEITLIKFIHPNELVTLLTSLINNLQWYYTTTEREVWYINQIRNIIKSQDIPEVNALL